MRETWLPLLSSLLYCSSEHSSWKNGKVLRGWRRESTRKVLLRLRYPGFDLAVSGNLALPRLLDGAVLWWPARVSGLLLTARERRECLTVVPL